MSEMFGIPKRIDQLLQAHFKVAFKGYHQQHMEIYIYIYIYTYLYMVPPHGPWFGAFDLYLSSVVFNVLFFFSFFASWILCQS